MTIDAPFDISIGSHDPGALRVVSFRGRERLSKPFVWDVVVAGHDVDEASFMNEAMGQPARLLIHGAAGSRAVHGVVTRVASAGRHLHGRSAWKVRLSPRVATLRHRRNSRIFQDRTTPEIVSVILRESGIVHRWETRQAYARRSYCVQYEETDLDFVHRLLAEVGVFYHFEHAGDAAPPGDAETMVFGDSAEHRPIDGDSRLVYRAAQAGSTLQLAEHHVTAFHAARAMAPGSIVRRDYDFGRPLVVLDAAAHAGATERSPAGAGEVYEHHGEYAEAEAEQKLERAALEQLRRKAHTASGGSHCPRVLVGRRFTLDEHELAGFDGDYLVTGVEHEGRSPETVGDGSRTYENRFTCVPASTVLRPPRRARQVRQVVETAVVAGPSGQEIHTDEHGRIKVQFHWDREGERNEHSSCWMRVAQAWAGTGWGFQFIPRIGMEVLVSFLGGDPDRPMVIGCVPNATHPPPYPLPENKTTSGIKTESSPGGGGFNEIAFEDRKDAELLRVRAQRDMHENVLNDRDATVGRDQRVSIGQHHTESIGGNRALRVAGDEVVEVQGSRTEMVQGNVARTVRAGETATVLGDVRTMVGGRASVAVAGDVSLASPSGVSMTVGTKEAGGGVNVFGWGDLRFGTEARFEVAAAKAVTFRCGKSRIELSPERVTIEGPELVLVGSSSVSLFGKDTKGPAMHLTEEAEIVSSSVRIFSRGASIELEENADVRGKLVRLNCGNSKKPEAKDGAKAADETRPFTVRLADVEFLPYANKRYQLVAAGQRMDGTTDGDGVIRVDVPKSATTAEITLWVDEYPTGHRRQWSVSILDEIAPGGTAAGAMLRLKNLGYPAGTDEEEIDDETAEALRSFQRDHELPATGELDARTAAMLEDAHGH